MCGIVGQITKDVNGIQESIIEKMNSLISHRGPDDSGIWINKESNIGLGHRRLSIIDLSEHGHQPMHALDRYTIAFNGEIYNYKEIRKELEQEWSFQSNTDTEVILATYAKYGTKCLKKFRGMFALAIWDKVEKILFCARDQFGIKPFYYSIANDKLSFASEAKALSPAIEEKSIDHQALLQYLTFQIPIDENTLIKEIKQLMPGHFLTFQQHDASVKIEKYWDITYNINKEIKSEQQASEAFHDLLMDSINIHLNSDVPVGSYLSGGVDSSLISILAAKQQKITDTMQTFHGRFMEYPGYDESKYAIDAANLAKQDINIKDIKSSDFLNDIEKVIYHLDFPVAGPGSLPQFEISELASQKVKVVLGGQGGDEIFGGYARYMVGYLEQCIKANIMDTEDNLEIPFADILPNIKLLKQYTPLIKTVWSDGLFDDFASRYMKIINRSNDFKREVKWEYFKEQQSALKENFYKVFNKEGANESGFINQMLHFDFKTLLPALLQVEDRMSMAHGIEARVPFLDTPIVEFAASLDPKIKFSNGKMKNLLKTTFRNDIPQSILNRKDKMGFTVPLKEWFEEKECREYIIDTFKSGSSKGRDFINYDEVISSIESGNSKFSRKIWGLLSLEIWMKQWNIS